MTLVSPSALYFPALDGLRFFAFLLVFIHHLPPSGMPMLDLVSKQGWVGVHVFLFLSAYLLTALLQAEYNASGRISIAKFYIRRGLRIWPLYFAFCVIAFTYSLVVNDWTDWKRLGGLMLFVDNILAGLTGYNPIAYTSHLWTISLEEQFYLFLPLMLTALLASTKSMIFGVLSLWLSFIALRVFAVVTAMPHPFIWTSVFSADALLLGTLFGALRPTPRGGTFGRLILFALGVAALFSGEFFSPIQYVGKNQIVVYALIAVGAAAITTVVLHESMLNFLASSPLRYLGKISYGLYVFHLLGIATGAQVATWMQWQSWWVGSAFALFVTVALSVLSYELFERKFLKMKRRYETVRSRPI